MKYPENEKLLNYIKNWVRLGQTNLKKILSRCSFGLPDQVGVIAALFKLDDDVQEATDASFDALAQLFIILGKNPSTIKKPW